MLIKRWKIEDVKDERGWQFTVHIEHKQLPNGDKYYECSSSYDKEVTEEFAKKLISIMTEDLERGGGEVWLNKEGKPKKGMTLNYIEGKILKAGWHGEERRRKKRLEGLMK